MLKEKSFDKRLTDVNTGPAGIDCPCCGISPKNRKEAYRRNKTRVKAFWRKEIQAMIQDS
jgi:hypothetical protein